MATNDLITAETAERRRVAVVAILAAVLTLGSPVLAQQLIGNAPTDNLLSQIMVLGDHRGAFLLSAALSALGLFGVIYVLDFLARATKARDPETKPYGRLLVLIAGLAVAVYGCVTQVVTASHVVHWTTESTYTYEEVRDSLNLGVISYIGSAGQFVFAIGFILVGLNAMRVGLLTRFLGYLGAASAVLFAIPILVRLPLPIVQSFWLVAVGLLLWNVRSPRQPPAWPTGSAVPWPSSAELREQRVRAAEARRGETGRSATDEPQVVEGSESHEASETDATGGPVASGARRKRKKRR